MNDKQIAQLSGWVRPRVKKYTSFNLAMKGFRAFITAASQDKSISSTKVSNEFVCMLQFAIELMK